MRPPQMPASGKTLSMSRSVRSLSVHLGALCAILLQRLASEERSRHQAVARDAAQHIATSVDLALTTSHAMLEVLATSDLLRRGDLEAFSERVAEVTRLNGAQIALYDIGGCWLSGPSNGDGHAPPPCVPGEMSRLAMDRKQPQVSGVRRGSRAGGAMFDMVVSVAATGRGRGIWSPLACRSKASICCCNARAWRRARLRPSSIRMASFSPVPALSRDR